MIPEEEAEASDTGGFSLVTRALLHPPQGYQLLGAQTLNPLRTALVG